MSAFMIRYETISNLVEFVQRLHGTRHEGVLLHLQPPRSSCTSRATTAQKTANGRSSTAKSLSQ